MEEIKLSFEEKLEAFLGNLRDYLDGRVSGTPVLNVDGSNMSADVYVDDDLAKEVLSDMNVYRKHFNALRHGYISDSKGKNGIRDVHINDGRIYRLTNTAWTSAKGKKLFQKYCLMPEATCAVKVVAHDPSLRRLYGFMDTKQSRVVLFGVDNYK